jgi:hypothetical protein
VIASLTAAVYRTRNPQRISHAYDKTRQNLLADKEKIADLIVDHPKK